MTSKKNTIPAVVVMLALLSSQALAVPIVPKDFDALVLLTEDLVVAPLTTDIRAFNFTDIGDLTSSVYFDGSTYTYVLEVTPSVDNVSEFNTSFDTALLDGAAGYSFSQASAIGEFDIFYDDDGSIDWDHVLAEGETPPVWNADETLTLFYQSSYSPHNGDYYQIINSSVGAAVGYAPDLSVSIPDASTLFLLGSACLIGFAALRKRPM